MKFDHQTSNRRFWLSENPGNIVVGRPSLNRQRSRLNVTQEAPRIWTVVPTYESRARSIMSQCESPTSHTQYRSRYLVIIQGRRERCKSPLYSVRVWLKHLPVFQIKLTSTERKHEDTAQCRIGAVSARRTAAQGNMDVMGKLAILVVRAKRRWRKKTVLHFVHFLATIRQLA